MWLRKNKSEPEQGRGPERQVIRSGGANPAFSYYNNNRDEVGVRERLQSRQDRTETLGRGDKPSAPHSRTFLTQLPLWGLLVLAIACGLKVLLLSTSPKVIVVGNTAISATYVQPVDVYAAAAHKLLTSSITNRTKLTANLGGTARSLEHQFPELQAVSLGLPLMGSRPIVYVQIAQPSLILQTGRGNFALNKSGVVLIKLQAIPPDVPLVVDQSGVQPHPGSQFLPSGTVAFARAMTYQLAAAHITVSSFTLPAGSPYELDVRLSGQQYYIRCNLAEDPLVQSGAAVATIQRLGGTTPGAYLDVRVPGRVYYK